MRWLLVTLSAPVTIPQYLVVFSLDTTALSRQNPRHHIRCSRASRTSAVTKIFKAVGFSRRERGEGIGRQGARRFRALRPLREKRCNTCPALPCSVSIRNAKPAANGCAPISPLPLRTTATAPAAAIFSATFRRRSARASACAPARSPRVPARAEEAPRGTRKEPWQLCYQR